MYNLRCLPFTGIRSYPSKNAVIVSRPLLLKNKRAPSANYSQPKIFQRKFQGFIRHICNTLKLCFSRGTLNTLCLLIMISNTLAIGFVCMCLCIQWKDINRFLGLSGWSPTPSVPVERPNMFPARLLILTQFLLFCLQSWEEVFWCTSILRNNPVRRLEALWDERRG